MQDDERNKNLIAAIMHNKNESYAMARAIASVYPKDLPVPELRNKQYDHLYFDLENAIWLAEVNYDGGRISFYQTLARQICEIISPEYNFKQKIVFEKYCHHMDGAKLDKNEFKELQKNLGELCNHFNRRMDYIVDSLIAFYAALCPEEFYDNQDYDETSIVDSPRELEINPKFVYSILNKLK